MRREGEDEVRVKGGGKGRGGEDGRLQWGWRHRRATLRY